MHRSSRLGLGNVASKVIVITTCASSIMLDLYNSHQANQEMVLKSALLMPLNTPKSVYNLTNMYLSTGECTVIML